MTRVMLALGLLLTGLAVNAGEDAAEDLVASKKKADMTYRQLMEVMGGASAMVHEGIIRENQQMVREGANIIRNHPAPKHKPWTIMDKSDQAAFKQSLLSFNKTLDTHAGRAAKEAAEGRWAKAAEAAHELTNSCVNCHAMWREKGK